VIDTVHLESSVMPYTVNWVSTAGNWTATISKRNGAGARAAFNSSSVDCVHADHVSVPCGTGRHIGGWYSGIATIGINNGTACPQPSASGHVCVLPGVCLNPSPPPPTPTPPPHVTPVQFLDHWWLNAALAIFPLIAAVALLALFFNKFCHRAKPYQPVKTV
jgi:hypothetical protein